MNIAQDFPLDGEEPVLTPDEFAAQDKEQSSAEKARALVSDYLRHGFRLVFWPQRGDQKGPTEAGWPSREYLLCDYRDGDRVGLKVGVELTPGRIYYDVDIDWGPGAAVAAAILPASPFTFGREGSREGARH
jgi:hypothetical protein